MLGAAAALPLAMLAGEAWAQRRPRRGRNAPKTREVASLAWTGTARLYGIGTATIEVGVETSVVPFVSARSASWLTVEGPAKRRTLVIEPTEAWTERDGVRTPLSAQQALHERQQYGIYGYMLGLGAEVSKAENRRRLQQPGYPPADLYYENGRLAFIDYIVDPPRAGAKLGERFTLTGEQVSNEVKFPQSLSILQEGRPYYDLTITSFQATWK